jgi:DNA-binding MarR family transcriptional regulator
MQPHALNVLASIHVLSRQIGRAFYGEIARRYGVGVPEWRVMLTLARRPAATSGEIAAQWAMEKMAVSRAVRRLERAGLVARRRVSNDRRRRALRLTAAGRRLYARILPAADARYRAIMACLGPAERAGLRRSLARLIAETGRLAEADAAT